MSQRVVCQNCGAQVDLPEGYARAKIRCIGCGYYAEVPAEFRDARPEPPAAPVPAPPTARRAPSPPPAAPPPDSVPPRRRSNILDDEDEADTTPLGLASPPPPPPSVVIPKPATSKPAARVRPQVNPRDNRPQFEPTPSVVPPLLEGTQDEDDDRPYAVPGEGLKRCPECRGQLPLDADLCVHCGVEIGTGAKAKRTYQPIDVLWHEGWAPKLRFQLFLGLQVLNLFAAILLMATSSNSLTDFSGLCTLAFTNLFQIGLQAFLMGSYDMLHVRRTAKGTATLTRTRRLAFLPLAPTKISWKQSTNVGIAGADVGWFARLLCLYFVINAIVYTLTGIFFSAFMLGLAAIYFGTAAGFYWLVLRPQRFEVNLCDVYGSTDEIVFRCDDREQAEDVAHVLADATGLFYKPVM